MSKFIKDLTELMIKNEAKAKLKNIKQDISNLEEVYKNNLNVWYYRNSENREPVDEEFEIINYNSKDPDKLICSRMFDGITLTEEEFIEEEIQLLSTLENYTFDKDDRINRIKVNALKGYLKYLKDKQGKNVTIEESNPNPYPGIFTDKGFLLFDRLHSEYKDTPNILTDYSFIYRIMHSGEYILEHIRPEMFKNWISKKPYEVTIDHKIKTLDRCITDNKMRSYKIAIDLIDPK